MMTIVFALISGRRFGATALAVDAADDRPLGERFGGLLEFARLPRAVELVLVGVVLGQRAGRVLHVPEVGRGNRVPARAELGVPAAAADVQTAAEDLVDVAHREGNVVEAALRDRRLQQEEVVMAAFRR